MFNHFDYAPLFVVGKSCALAGTIAERCGCVRALPAAALGGRSALAAGVATSEQRPNGRSNECLQTEPAVHEIHAFPAPRRTTSAPAAPSTAFHRQQPLQRFQSDHRLPRIDPSKRIYAASTLFFAKKMDDSSIFTRSARTSRAARRYGCRTSIRSARLKKIESGAARI
ncbi:MAG: hypothetical protein WD847_06890 [Pirellulales bacterium]